jgi:hypothetical protein
LRAELSDDLSKMTDEKELAMKRLVLSGYVEPTKDHPGAAFRLTPPVPTLLADRGVGLNEA